MENVIKDIGERLRGMREILDISPAEMAVVTGVAETEYLGVEAGQKDFSFTFLYKAAHRFGLDLTELITGESPHLTGYTLVRQGDGLPIERRAGFKYLNLAASFRDRAAEPFLVTAPYQAGAEAADISLNTHAGQEMDFILSGTLRVQIGGNEEILHEGDTVYYDSSRPHGMVAISGKPCQFLAIVINTSGCGTEAK
ncbi:MAG TPA: XRE family transcriptional regulator [Clostridiales bacterium]|nr:XRE family transcriptional regulator [Clostridiales bacterium]